MYCFEKGHFEIFTRKDVLEGMMFCKPDVLDILKLDAMKPDVLKSEVLWVYQPGD